MSLAVAPEEVLDYLGRLPDAQQRVAYEFIRFLAERAEAADELVDVHRDVVAALEEIRAGDVDRRDWRVVLNEL